MANETKALILEINEESHLCIPAAEAREFLKLVIRAVKLVNHPIFSQRLARDRALEYQAKLPEEE